MPAPFLDNHHARRRDRKIERFVDAAFAALHFRLEGNKLHADWTGEFEELCLLGVSDKGIDHPGRHSFPRGAFVFHSLSAGTPKHPRVATLGMAKCAVAVMNETAPAIDGIERDSRTRQTARRGMQFSGKFRGLAD